MTRFVVGIDLGTTHTVVAFAPREGDADPLIFKLPQLVSARETAERELLPSFLFAALPGELAQDPFGDAPWILGEQARRRGAEVPGRLVASSKSWLCHPSVDRSAAILPWGADEEATDLPKLSPVDAATRLLAHVKRAWDASFPEAPLADQDVVLTVPASFDEVARELSALAAERAGLRVRLLEEPQAAFYDFMRRAGDTAMGELARKDALVLVCDVGGGTTDLSLLRVRASAEVAYEVERVAVGRHLLLGGDNMDLALAHAAEPRLVALPGKLDAARFGQLALACRHAKELLLGDGALDEAQVTVLGHGAKLLGNTLSTRISREEAERLVLDGFFPFVARDARPTTARGGLVAFGLPYERDVAITRHVAQFFVKHAEGREVPTSVLLNGGVFNAERIAARLLEVLSAWGAPVSRLEGADPDRAVARGAVAYGLALLGRGVRIEGGAARSFFVGLEKSDEGRRAICVVPKGSREGVKQTAHGRTLGLVVGRPVRFDLFVSDDAATPGAIVTLDDERFDALAPAVVRFDKGAEGKDEIKVELEGELTPIGTLDLACHEIAGENRRFRLAFQLRDAAESAPSKSLVTKSSAPAGSGRAPRRELAEPVELVDRVFGKGRADVGGREVKDLVRDLERLLGPREEWSIEVARALFDALADRSKGRKRSADHERVFWLLSGFCLRPGFGDPADSMRAQKLAPLFAERLAFADEPRGWQQFWIAWRRVAGGLDEAQQTAMRDVLDPLLAPSERRLKKAKGWKAEAEGDLLELVALLERVAPARKSELGSWLLERTWTNKDARLWAALGRIGARVPAYASAHHVLGPLTAERWIEHLLREKWNEMSTASEAAVRLARRTGDRARDVSEKARVEIEKRLKSVGAKDEWLRAVREVVLVEEAERAAFLGDSLPVGLRLVDG